MAVAFKLDSALEPKMDSVKINGKPPDEVIMEQHAKEPKRVKEIKDRLRTEIYRALNYSWPGLSCSTFPSGSFSLNICA